MQTTSRADDVAEIAYALMRGDKAKAEEVAQSRLPWQRYEKQRLPISTIRALRVFFRDKFIDRYSGSKLVFPGALMVVGQLMKDQFPMSPTWKVSESHIIFWELWPVIDHGEPVTRGGVHDESNFFTTSATNNIAKGHSRIEEIGWQLLPQADPEQQWDGLVSWYCRMVESDPTLLEHGQTKAWDTALRNILRSQTK